MIPSWSFSRRSVFEQCPYRAKLAWVDKISDNTPRTAADRGTEIHTEAESYVKGSESLPSSLRHFANDFASLRTHYADGRVLLEQEWGFSRDWDVAPWQSAWLRLKCDAVVNLSATELVVSISKQVVGLATKLATLTNSYSMQLLASFAIPVSRK